MSTSQRSVQVKKVKHRNCLKQIMKGIVKNHLCSPASSCLAVVKKLLSASKGEHGIPKEDYTKLL